MIEPLLTHHSYDKNKSIILQAGMLTMKVAKADQSFEIRNHNDIEYMEVQWRARAEYDGMELFWRFFVHPSGEFADDNFDNLKGSMVVTQKLDGFLRYDAMEFKREDTGLE